MNTQNIKDLSEKFYQEIVAIRHDIHMNPEIGFEEVKTAALVKKTLEKYGIPYQSEIAKTGVLGILKGNKPGKTVLLRADMDALVLQDDSGVPYASKIPNRMHACGHDGHTAGLLGAAMILSQMKDEIKGTIKFMFQPAEENEGGALPMIEAGILENPKVDAAFGCHVWGEAKEGTAKVCHGPMMASPDIFELEIIGKGGHGANPHLAIDPIVVSAYVITTLQSIISRRINPLESVVLSIGSIKGGDVHNIIPNSVKITGTVRTLSEKVREQIPTEMENVIKGVTSTHGADYKFDFIRKFPVLINDHAITDIAQEAFSKILGTDHVEEVAHKSMGAEDFAYLAQNVPSTFVYVGIAEDENNPVLHHNPKFKWHDKNLKILAQGYAQMALDFLNKEER